MEDDILNLGSGELSVGELDSFDATALETLLAQLEESGTDTLELDLTA